MLLPYGLIKAHKKGILDIKSESFCLNVFSNRCLGSTQHLKNKYGGGYVLDIKSGRDCSSEQDWNDIHLEVQSIFESSEEGVDIKIEEAFADRRTYSVPQAVVSSLGHVFSRLEKCKLFCKNILLLKTKLT